MGWNWAFLPKEFLPKEFLLTAFPLTANRLACLQTENLTVSLQTENRLASPHLGYLMVFPR